MFVINTLGGVKLVQKNYKVSAEALEWEIPYSGLGAPRDYPGETFVKNIGELVSAKRNVGIVTPKRDPLIAKTLRSGLQAYVPKVALIDGVLLDEQVKYSLSTRPISLSNGGVLVWDDIPKTPVRAYARIQNEVLKSGGEVQVVGIAHGDYVHPIFANSLDEVPYLKEAVPIADDLQGRQTMWSQLNELLKGRSDRISFSEEGAAAAINIMRKVSEPGLLPATIWANSEIINLAASRTRAAGRKKITREDFEIAYAEAFSGAEFIQTMYSRDFKGARKGKSKGMSNCLAIVNDGTKVGVADKIYVTVTKNPMDAGVVLTAELHKDESDDMALAKSRQEVEQYLDERYPGLFEKVGITVASTTDAIVGGPSMSGLIAATCELALAEIPINQNVAATGAIGPEGSLRAIGGVNEKVKGWWQILGRGDIYGGVAVPSENVSDMRLDRDIIEGVRNEKFEIYSVHTVEELVEVLSGVPYSSVRAAVKERLSGKKRKTK